eukprot:s1160_g14.t2
MRLEALGARWVDGSCLQQRRGPQTPSHQIRRHRLGHRPKLCTIPLHTSSESCLAKKKLRSASHRPASSQAERVDKLSVLSQCFTGFPQQSEL